MLRGAARDQSGVTIVEAMVAAFLLLVGILGSVSVFDSSRRESATGERQQIAVEQAQAELERMRDVPYEKLAVDPASPGWESSGAPGDPLNRLDAAAGTFRVGPDRVESLTFAQAQGGGIAPLSRLDVAADGVPMNMWIYRFVTWRDEDCPVADTSGITGPLDELLVGLEPATGLIDGLLGEDGLLSQALGLLLPDSVRDALQAVGVDVEEIEAVLDARVANLTALVGSLGQAEIDPCDIDLEALGALDDTATIAALEPALRQLDGALAGYDGCVVDALGIGLVCDDFGPVQEAIDGLPDPDELAADMDALIAALDAIDTADHDQNTKRLTVAVVLEPRTGSGPFKPVWATSVAGDPEAALLSQP